MLVHVKVEQHVHAVAFVAEEILVFGGNNIGFAQENRVALTPLQEIPQAREVFVVQDTLLSGHATFDHERNGIDSESGDSELEPVTQDPLDFCLNLGILCVQIRLEFVKPVVVPLAGDLVVAPDRLLDAGKHHALAVIGRPFFRPHIPIAVFRLPIRARSLKPGMLVGRMVQNQIDDDPKAPLLCLIRKIDKVPRRAMTWINAVVIGYVVARVAIGRRLKGLQPYTGDTQPRQVVEAA